MRRLLSATLLVVACAATAARAVKSYQVGRIVADKDGLGRLDNHYTVYGQGFKGRDIVELIVSVPKDSAKKPLTPITLHVDVVNMSADGSKSYGFVVK